MARTTIETIKSIMSTGLTDPQIHDIMVIANGIVTTLLSAESSLSADTLKNIETYLAAHLIAIGKERQVASERIGDIWITYQGKFGEFLQSTTYGQMVLFLDTTGKMQQQTKGRARLRAIQQDSDDASGLTSDQW